MQLFPLEPCIIGTYTQIVIFILCTFTKNKVVAIQGTHIYSSERSCGPLRGVFIVLSLFLIDFWFLYLFKYFSKSYLYHSCLKLSHIFLIISIISSFANPPKTSSFGSILISTQTSKLLLKQYQSLFRHSYGYACVFCLELRLITYESKVTYSNRNGINY